MEKLSIQEWIEIVKAADAVRDAEKPLGPFGLSEQEMSVVRSGLGVPSGDALNPSDYPPIKRKKRSRTN